MKKIEMLIKKIFWLPFIIGFIGYYFLGELPFWESVYATSALYFVNPVSEINNLFVLIAKILAVIFITSIIVSLMNTFVTSIDHFIKRKFKDSTTIYTDNEMGYVLNSNTKHGYIIENKKTRKLENTKCHIVMFSNDYDNISFYTTHQNELKNKNVYILTNHIDSFLLRPMHNNNVHFFNIYELTARLYWQKYSLLKYLNNKKIKIAIIGNGNIAFSIFKFGYLNNIYSLNQEIEYHLWGFDSTQKDFLENLEFVNNDVVKYYDDEIYRNINKIINMDRIIIAKEKEELDTLQQILYKSLTIDIHFYSVTKNILKDIFMGENIEVFGDSNDILKESIIKGDLLNKQGKLMNFDYYLRKNNMKFPNNYKTLMEQCWDELDGFKKGSSIARADYYWIQKWLKEHTIIKQNELMELEHIRWCRYHYINHWSYGKERDDLLRKHNLLVPYNELPLEEKLKDSIYNDIIKKEINSLI
ncbi:hypothetical protein GTN31_02375 [Macrococcoides canis]|uniref:RyR domain-containing protein n=1 Tax=Macrococcoides canis TaxID=1855823 RepID=UPI0013E98610|nr:RyR domain-containing protein [Macrococcus canis]QIH75183.1 hypothetical protein GTN31_02375 [Macrococcus canis]